MKIYDWRKFITFFFFFLLFEILSSKEEMMQILDKMA